MFYKHVLRQANDDIFLYYFSMYSLIIKTVYLSNFNIWKNIIRTKIKFLLNKFPHSFFILHLRYLVRNLLISLFMLF